MSWDITWDTAKFTIQELKNRLWSSDVLVYMMWDKKEKNPGIIGPTESSGHGGSIAQSLVRSLTSQTSSQGWLSSSSSSSSLSSAIGRQSLVIGRRHHHHHQWWFTVIIIILMCLMMVMSLTFDILGSHCPRRRSRSLLSMTTMTRRQNMRTMKNDKLLSIAAVTAWPLQRQLKLLNSGVCFVFPQND